MELGGKEEDKNEKYIGELYVSGQHFEILNIFRDKSWCYKILPI